MKRHMFGLGVPGQPRSRSRSKMSGIPIVSKLIVRGRLKSGSRAIDKAEKKIQKIIDKTSDKVSKIVEAAENTDSHQLIEKAEELRDRAEGLCPTDGGGGSQKIDTPRDRCKKAIMVAVGRDIRGAEGKLKQYIDVCTTAGEVTIPADIVEHASKGAKNVDVTVERP